MADYDCVIVGAGISGLSVAYELHRRGASVLVVEAGGRAGGVIQSERTPTGFLVDNGPNTVTSGDPNLWEHFAALGIEGERLVAGASGSHRYVVLNGAPEALPGSPGSFARTPLLSAASKLRMLAEPLLPRAAADESVAAFFTRRLGAEPARRLVDPFVSGVYAGDPDTLSARAAFPSLWEAEQGYGSIVLGMIAKGLRRDKSKPRTKRALFNFRNGMAAWPEAIADALGPERVWLRAKAVGVEPSRDGWDVTVARRGLLETVRTTQVVLAAPAYATATLVAALDTATARALAGIPYPSVAVVHLGYRRDDVAHPLDGFGVLCPSQERRQVLGTLWNSSLFAGRAPEGTVLTTSFVGGARAPERAAQNDAELIAAAHGEQRALIGAKGEPLLAHVARWERAIPQYVAGHAERMATLEQFEQQRPGLWLRGNYRDGISVERCWQNGRALAERLVAQRDRSSTPNYGVTR